MKREGRQHGVVRSYPILPTPLSRQRRYVKTVDSSSVAGLFTKVSRKPTNQSKFTGKCGTTRCLGCHLHPVSKSKDKAKGSMKLRSIGSDGELIAGCSAVDALAYLASNEESYDDGTVDESGINGLVREEEIECVNYCDVGLCWGDGDDDGWYLVGDFLL